MAKKLLCYLLASLLACTAVGWLLRRDPSPEPPVGILADLPRVLGFRVMPKCNLVAVLVYPTYVRLYHLVSRNLICEFDIDSQLNKEERRYPLPYCFDCDPHGRIAAIGMGKIAYLIDIFTGRIQRRIAASPSGINCVRFSSNGEHLAIGQQDGTLLVMDLRSLAIRQQRAGEQGIKTIAQNPTVDMFVVADFAGRIWSTAPPFQEIVIVKEAGAEPVVDLAISSMTGRLYSVELTTIRESSIFGGYNVRYLTALCQYCLKPKVRSKILSFDTCERALGLSISGGVGDRLAISTNRGNVLFFDPLCKPSLTSLRVGSLSSMVQLSFVNKGNDVLACSIFNNSELRLGSCPSRLAFWNVPNR